MSTSNNKIIILGTSDILGVFKEHMVTLNNGSYNLNEIGALVVDCYQTTPLDDPYLYREIKTGFCEHFSRQHDHRDFETAFETYGCLYDEIFTRLDSVCFEHLGQEGFMMAFQNWIAGEDLAILLYSQRWG